ncbi:MAG TPA: NUDIX domain-containing protein [Candidatus Eisenbacteria bacterium]|nr:NUDIX domain-containing protein [Candidatus Eisenbacteria bacterium]
MAPADAAAPRQCVRALFLTPQASVLLIRLNGRSGPLWITPGGGIDAGESHESALRRELEEEVGRSDFDVGPLVWVRDAEFEWNGRRCREREYFYLLRTDTFVPDLTGNPVPEEARLIVEHRWWLLDDLLRSEERFAPARMATLLAELVQNGPPSTPVETGD